MISLAETRAGLERQLWAACVAGDQAEFDCLLGPYADLLEETGAEGWRLLRGKIAVQRDDSVGVLRCNFFGLPVVRGWVSLYPFFWVRHHCWTSVSSERFWLSVSVNHELPWEKVPEDSRRKFGDLFALLREKGVEV